MLIIGEDVINEEPKKNNFMTKEEFDAYVRRYRDSNFKDTKAFNELRQKLLPYLRWLVKKHVSTSWSEKVNERGMVIRDFLDDYKTLQTEAEIGLWDAVRRYDPDAPDARRGHIPYLSKTIKNKLLAMSNKLKRKNNMYVPKGGRILWRQINQFINEYYEKNGKKPTDSELLKRFRITRFDLESLMAAHNVVSMQDLVGTEGGDKKIQRGELLSDNDLDSVYRRLTKNDKELQKVIVKAIAKLPKDQMIAIRERFRLPGFKIDIQGGSQPTYSEIREFYKALMPNSNKGIERLIKRGLKSLSNDKDFLKEVRSYEDTRIIVAISNLLDNNKYYVEKVIRKSSTNFVVGNNNIQIKQSGSKINKSYNMLCDCGNLNCSHIKQVIRNAKY
ncbi:MAG: hypothetical protein WC934_13885 [Acidithiobacillus sp.]|jgi:DNA-directed RNA polymerase specialized sigma subunit|uniref:sigma-70 family RNA polymerase sigma factor n=1 Tax=Acidithiobacillus sp. TaxID=1872118 RepID=UPI0035606AD5